MNCSNGLKRTNGTNRVNQTELNSRPIVGALVTRSSKNRIPIDDHARAMRVRGSFLHCTLYCTLRDA
jgi:hypothetical protein